MPCAPCAGSILRTELYALDGSDREDRPYTVSEIQLWIGGDRAAGCWRYGPSPHLLSHSTSQRTTQWERGDDPMTQFSYTRFTDDKDVFDPFGRPLAQTQIACPRGWRTLDDKPGDTWLATHSRTHYAIPNEAKDLHPRSCSKGKQL